MKSREIKKFRKTYTKYEKECVFEGYKLAVLFDEKDEVKRYGGRWHPASVSGGYWWMPKNKLTDTVSPDQTTVREWLNDNQMIVGQYGIIDTESRILNNFEDADVYELRHMDSTKQSRPENIAGFFWMVWKAIGIAAWNNGGEEMAFMTLDDGRTLWDNLMKSGYRRIIREKTLTTEENTV